MEDLLMAGNELANTFLWSITVFILITGYSHNVYVLRSIRFSTFKNIVDKSFLREKKATTKNC